MTQAHTPTPWQVKGVALYDEHGNQIAMATSDNGAFGMSDRIANIAFAGECVNVHDKLVAALRKIVARFDAFDAQHPSLATNEALRVIAAGVEVDARALLAEIDKG